MYKVKDLDARKKWEIEKISKKKRKLFSRRQAPHVFRLLKRMFFVSYKRHCAQRLENGAENGTFD